MKMYYPKKYSLKYHKRCDVLTIQNTTRTEHTNNLRRLSIIPNIKINLLTHKQFILCMLTLAAHLFTRHMRATTTLFDREKKNCSVHVCCGIIQRETYKLEAMAQDKGYPPLSRTVEVQIDVVDRANNPPVWDHNVYGPIYVKENMPVGGKVVSIKARSVLNLILFKTLKFTIFPIQSTNHMHSTCHFVSVGIHLVRELISYIVSICDFSGYGFLHRFTFHIIFGSSMHIFTLSDVFFYFIFWLLKYSCKSIRK